MGTRSDCRKHKKRKASLNALYYKSRQPKPLATVNAAGKLVLVANAKKAASLQPQRLDPTRTGMIRRKWAAEIERRFNRFKKAVRKLIVEENAFGLGRRSVTGNYRADQERDDIGRWVDEGGSYGGVKTSRGEITQEESLALFDRIRSGGFTYQPVDDTMPARGYAVATFRKAEKVFDVDKLTPGDVYNFLVEHATHFDNPKVHAGGWVSDGKVYLDLSTIADSEQEGLSLGVQHDQLGIFDLEHGVTIEVPSQRTRDHHGSKTATSNESAEWEVKARAYESRRRALSAAYWQRANGQGTGGNGPQVNECGAGEDGNPGFQPGNTCAAGDGGSGIVGTGRVRSDGRRVYPGTLPANATTEAVSKVAADYVEKHGEALGVKPLPPHSPQPLDTRRSREIGKFYEEMPDTSLADPKVRAAYEALASEVKLQYQHMVAAGMRVNFSATDPYPSSKAMIADVGENKNLNVFLTSPESFGPAAVTHDHPLLKGTGIYHGDHELVYNDLFRAVHDYFGHASEGNEFGPVGEERAWLKHSGMFSKLARGAMSMETRGQNSWVNFGPHMHDADGYRGDKKHPRYLAPKDRPYAVQKVGVMPDEWTTATLVDNENCGTGAGGFQPGNTCAKGDGGSAQTDSPKFKKWFGDSKVVDAAGNPLVVYHGTTGDFQQFDQSRANAESDLGAGIYFSNNPEDVDNNYAGFGPDITSRIERLAEQVMGNAYEQPQWGTAEHEEAWAIAKEAAKQELGVEHAGAVMPVFLSIENPAILGGHDETQLTYDIEYDEAGEEVVSEGGTLLDFTNALHNVAGRFYDADASEAINSIMENGFDGGMGLSKAIEIVKASDSINLATDDKGNIVIGEVIRQTLEEMGHDGIIDKTVNDKFGTGKSIGTPMAGMNEDTTHYIVFDPKQIKSAIGNKGTFSTRSSSVVNEGDNCGTGAGGFQPGNTCAKGDGGDDPLKSDPSVLWHGTPSGKLVGSHYGIHVGTFKAAKQALEARIGVPASGEWDGTREYGKTLLAGRNTLMKIDPRGFLLTGYNASPPDEDYYPRGDAKYSGGDKVALDSKPAIFAVRVRGPMTNDPDSPMTDEKANSTMARQKSRGTARRGYYYKNDGEDAGSISAVVPSLDHLEIVRNVYCATGEGGGKDPTCSPGPSGDAADPMHPRAVETNYEAPRPGLRGTYPGHNFVGPNFNYDDTVKPTNHLDALAKEHDRMYKEIRKRYGTLEAFGKWNHADEWMFKEMRKIPARERSAAWRVANLAWQLKRALAPVSKRLKGEGFKRSQPVHSPEEFMLSRALASVFNENCGIGPDGFEPGNDCAKGGGSDPSRSRDFLGYHASKYDEPKGIVDPEYGNHFAELLDSMPNEYRDYAMEQGWLEAEIEPNDATAKEIASWLREKGIGMVFVSHDKPYNQERRGGASYGHNSFHVTLPQRDRVAQVLDPGEIDASIILYHKDRPPKFDRIPTENENCGTGAGGFQPGNTCAAGDGVSYESLNLDGSLKDDLENIEFGENTTAEHVRAVLEHHNCEPVQFMGEELPGVYSNGSEVIEWDGEGTSTSISDAGEFVYNYDMTEIEAKYEDRFNDDFWSGPGPVFHATQDENGPAIEENGLNMADDTRGMSNRWSGAAVYTTAEWEEAISGSYGDTIFEIDTKAMARDGYKPVVRQEPDVVRGELTGALAHALGDDTFEYDYEAGMSPNTIVFYGHIPPQYLKNVSPDR